MTIETREEIAKLLTTLADKQKWDHKTWERCQELVTENLDNELLDSFYFDFLQYPRLFNIRFFNRFQGPKVSALRIDPNPATLEEFRSQFLQVAAALRAQVGGAS